MMMVKNGINSKETEEAGEFCFGKVLHRRD